MIGAILFIAILAVGVEVVYRVCSAPTKLRDQRIEYVPLGRA